MSAVYYQIRFAIDRREIPSMRVCVVHHVVRDVCGACDVAYLAYRTRYPSLYLGAFLAHHSEVAASGHCPLSTYCAMSFIRYHSSKDVTRPAASASS